MEFSLIKRTQDGMFYATTFSLENDMHETFTGNDYLAQDNKFERLEDCLGYNTDTRLMIFESADAAAEEICMR